MQRLSIWAKEQRGYDLITVIIGKDPFTDAVVPQNAENLIRGFMGLMEGGKEQYDQLKESGAIDRTIAKVNKAVARLNMTPAYIVQSFIDLWDSFSITDLAHPIAAFQRIIVRFGEPIGRLIAFVIEIVKIVIEAILIVMNFPFDLINNIIARAMQAFELIKKDPVGFLKNLLRAIKQGFIQFFDNILTHLFNGLKVWFLSEVKAAGIPLPTDFTVMGVIKWLLTVLDVTMEKIWKKLEERLGKPKVDKIKKMIAMAEKVTNAAGEAYAFIQDVQQRGFMAVMIDKVKEQLSNVWEMVLEAVKSFVMDQIIKKVTTKLLSMLDPTGIMAVVNSVIALYKAIQSFIRYLRQMLEIVNSFVEGTLQIAQGATKKAADFLEGALSSSIPIVIGFLANQVGLNLSERLKDALELVREKVDKGLTWVIDKVVTIIEKLVSLGKAAVGGKGNADVKIRAKDRLNELILPADTEAQIQQKIDAVKIELQPQGLSDLKLIPEPNKEGEFFIDAAASPFKHVLKLVKQLAGGRTPTARCQVSIKLFNKQDLSFVVKKQNINQEFRLQGGTTITLPKTYAVGQKINNSEVRQIATKEGKSQEFASIERSGGSWSVGGAVLLPEAGADELKLITWNTDTEAFNSGSNNSHAEYQFKGWIQAQPKEFLEQIKGINVNINLSPCDDCCAVLSGIVKETIDPVLAEEKKTILHDNLNVSWVTPYCRGVNSNQKTTPNGLSLLQGAGWKPSGLVNAECSNEGFQKTSLV